MAILRAVNTSSTVVSSARCPATGNGAAAPNASGLVKVLYISSSRMRDGTPRSSSSTVSGSVRRDGTSPSPSNWRELSPSYKIWMPRPTSFPPLADALRLGWRVGVIGVPGLQPGKIGVETMEEREEIDIEVDGRGGSSLLSKIGRSQGGWHRANDKDGSM